MTATVPPKGVPKAQRAAPVVPAAIESEKPVELQVDANEYISLLRQRNSQLQHELDIIQIAYVNAMEQNKLLVEDRT